MILRAKIFLLWLLALAIPVQGFAAVAQSGCAPAMLQAVAMMDHGMPGMHHGHDMQTQDMHAHDAASADQHQQQHASHGSCSSCATCTVGAVLPLALGTLPTPDLPSREYLALPAMGLVGYTPENPDRPPASS